MHLRLFKRHNRLALLGTLVMAAGCGGSKFTASASVAGSGGDGSVMDSAGAAGEPSDGGSSEGGAGGQPSGGSAGSGGKPASTCNCAKGSYCPDGTISCQSCADFSQLNFGAPEKLATVSQNAMGNERFPRAASTGTDLFYRTGLDATESIWYAASPVSGVGKQLIGAVGIVSGPLFAPGFSTQNFFYDRANALTGLRQIMADVWVGGALSGAAVVAPAPLNAETGTKDDFSVAIAADAKRVYWMSARNKNLYPDLVWTSYDTTPAPDPTVLDLQVQAGAGTCPRLGDDATPWVNAAGTLLLFRSQSVNTSCAPNDLITTAAATDQSFAYDLFATPLGKDGLPVAAGIALSSLNTTGGGSTETDPSLSEDACTIYFASDSGKGDFDLYRASRN